MTTQTAVTERAAPGVLEDLYNRVTGDEDARVCKDIPESACQDQPRNFFAYLGANLLGKVADEIASAKPTIPWLFVALGVPAVFTGLLVPIRESGVLVHQLAVAAAVRSLPIRKGCGCSGPSCRRSAYSPLPSRRRRWTGRRRAGRSCSPWSSTAWRAACAPSRQKTC